MKSFRCYGHASLSLRKERMETTVPSAIVLSKILSSFLKINNTHNTHNQFLPFHDLFALISPALISLPLHDFPSGILARHKTRCCMLSWYACKSRSGFSGCGYFCFVIFGTCGSAPSSFAKLLSGRGSEGQGGSAVNYLVNCK